MDQDSPTQTGLRYHVLPHWTAQASCCKKEKTKEVSQKLAGEPWLSTVGRKVWDMHFIGNVIFVRVTWGILKYMMAGSISCFTWAMPPCVSSPRRHTQWRTVYTGQTAMWWSMNMNPQHNTALPLRVRVDPSCPTVLHFSYLFISMKHIYKVPGLNLAFH